MTTTELEAYDAMMKDRDHWKSLYFTMRELSDNATDIAERREQENARLREENERLLDAIWQTVGWNESVGNNPEDVRLLQDALSNTKGETR
jgi:hypothetical protein